MSFKCLRIFSSVEGTLYTLKAEVGSYIHAGDETMVIETDAPSFIVCKVKQDESLKIYKGMEVKVYSQTKDRTFAAHVETIGNLSLNTQSQITNEVSLKEITVKIVFDDTNLKLPLNERVKVWFYRPLF
jgi:multidrug resistance efflux pump